VRSSRLLRAILVACVECFVPVAAAALASVAAGCGGDSASPSDDAGAPCMVVVPPTSCPTPPPSYSGEISSVVANYCAVAMCHSSGGAESVHDFTTYPGVLNDRLTFARQVALCPTSSSGMPPPGYKQPTQQQRLDLVTWAGICKAPNN
jgi:hypothetical protein